MAKHLIEKAIDEFKDKVLSLDTDLDIDCQIDWDWKTTANNGYVKNIHVFINRKDNHK